MAQTAVCHHCGKPMEPGRGTTPKKYCKVACRMAASRARNTAVVVPLPVREVGEPDRLVWRHAGSEDALGAQLERLELLLDQASPAAAAPLARAWFEVYRARQAMLGDHAKVDDPIDQLAAARVAGMSP